MANTYHKIYVHTVFAVKYREAILAPEWSHRIFGIIGRIINEQGCKTCIVNGVADHVHCLFRAKPTTQISDIMKHAKAKSSKWINDQGLLSHRFQWQIGYGCFSVGKGEMERVYDYIKGQQIHHSTESFQREYIALLQKHGIAYDPAYLFEELI